MFKKEKITFEGFSLRRRFNASKVNFSKEILLGFYKLCCIHDIKSYTFHRKFKSYTFHRKLPIATNIKPEIN